jgi:hypothetical protein
MKNKKNKKNIIYINNDDVDDSYYDVLNECDNVDEIGMNNNNLNSCKNKMSTSKNNIPKDSDANKNKGEDKDESIYLIQNYCTSSDDKKISEFLKFCINNGLFDNMFYDYNNNFSIMATKLHITFDQLSENDELIYKKKFISTFKNKYKYSGDLPYIFNMMDIKKDGKVTWDEFIEFFLPYIRYITV